jgi:hypothetical protein
MHLKSFATLLKSRRMWVWEIGGAAIYAVPVVIRLVTGNVVLPVLSLIATPWVGYYIPSNLIEKILVNAFFPGGAGAVAGEIFFSNAKSKILVGREKYVARLYGALSETAAWSLVQFSGGLLGIAGSWGGNLFEYPSVYPLNFLLASLSIFTPTIVGFVKNKIVHAYHGLKRSG